MLKKVCNVFDIIKLLAVNACLRFWYLLANISLYHIYKCLFLKSMAKFIDLLLIHYYK